MTDRPRPWWRSSYVVVAAAILFAAGAMAVGSTYASFSGETDNTTSTFPGGWIGAATSLAGGVSGTDDSLTWTPGTHGLTGQQLYGLDNGASSTCPGSGYSLTHTMASANTSSYTATNPSATTTSDKVGTTTLSTALPTPTTINMVSGITNSGTSLTVTSTTGMPAAPFEIQVDTGGNLEDMHVTAKGGSTLTVTRGQDGTSAVAHANGASVNVATVVLASATTFPSSNGYTFQIGSEDMTVLSGAGAATVIVTRGSQSTTIASHAASSPLAQISVGVTSASAFPGSGSYGIQIDGEQMTVTSGAGTTTWIVTRGAGSTTVNSHASGAVIAQTTDPVAGHYFCYQLVSTSASNWTATSSFSALQLGLVMTGVVITNGGTANSLTTNDTVAITFNQQQSTITNVASNTAIICEIWDGATPSNLTVYYDHVAYGTATNPCTSSTTPNYDVAISGMTITHAAAGSATINAQDVVSGTSPWTVTWTEKANGKALTGQATLTGTASQQVSSTNGGTDVGAACISATYGCTPTVTGTKY